MVSEWHHGQFMVKHYQKTVESAAKHQIMLDIHEPIKDTGLRRTWPNLMTRRGGTGPRSTTPGTPRAATRRTTPPSSPSRGLLSGPMDFHAGHL